MTITKAATRAVLEAACERLGLVSPRPKEGAARWMARVERQCADEGCDPLWARHARLYLEAAWRCGHRRDAEECLRMLHGARTMLRIGDAWAHAFASGAYDIDEDLADVVGAIAPERRLDEVGPERSLVVYLEQDGAPVVHEWMWMEGDGLPRDGYMLDDGAWREGFADRHEAMDAAASWDQRRKGHGRGLAYADTPALRDRRLERARDPATPIDALLELAGDPDEDVCIAVAENPNTPPEALVLLAGPLHLRTSSYGDSFEVHCHLSERPGLPDEAIRRLLEVESVGILANLIESGNVTPAVLAALRGSREAREVLVSSDRLESLALDVLEILLDDPSQRDALVERLPEPRLAALASRRSVSAPPILRRTYRLRSWARWDDQVHGFVDDFHAAFRLYPNLLQASPVTLARMDMAADPAHVRDDDGHAPNGYAPLTEFVGPGYTLELVVGEHLDDLVIVLFWDADPDGGGVPPEEDTSVEEDVLRRRASGA
jgi:hypothetical protein